MLELLNTAIRRPVDISNKLGITALATIPYISTRRERRFRTLSIVAAVIAVVGVVGGGLWLIDTRVIPLGQAVDRILSAVDLSVPARAV